MISPSFNAHFASPVSSRQWPWEAELSLGIGTASGMVWLWLPLDFTENSSIERESFLNMTFSLQLFQLHMNFFFFFLSFHTGFFIRLLWTNKRRWQQPNPCRKQSVFILPVTAMKTFLGERLWNLSYGNLEWAEGRGEGTPHVWEASVILMQTTRSCTTTSKR